MTEDFIIRDNDPWSPPEGPSDWKEGQYAWEDLSFQELHEARDQLNEDIHEVHRTMADHPGPSNGHTLVELLEGELEDVEDEICHRVEEHAVEAVISDYYTHEGEQATIQIYRILEIFPMPPQAAGAREVQIRYIDTDGEIQVAQGHHIDLRGEES